MTRPFRPSDFASHIAAGANLAVADGRCLARLAPSVAPIEGANRTLRFVFSDGGIDRYGDRIDPAGWQLANYKVNPVVLFGHDATQPPIGRASAVGVVGGRLMGSIEFMPEAISPLAESLFQMCKGGFLNAVSVGFLPIEFGYSTDKTRSGGIDFKRQELLEVSLVPIPALPTALIEARAAGVDTRAFAEWASRELTRKETNLMSRPALEIVQRAAAPSRAAPARPYTAAASAAPASAWESFGHFLRAVAQGSQPGAPADRRLVRAPTGLNETDPTAGGFTVSPEWAAELIGSMYEEAVVAPLCDRRQTDKPADVRLPAVDETSRAEGSRWGGSLSYWEAEGVTPPETLPRFRMLNPTATKLIALCAATGEMLDDVPMLESHVRRAFASEAAFKLDLAILRGTGAGTPLGITAAPSTITVAKAAGQASGTITSDNVNAMWSRLPAPCRKRAHWIICEDAEAQLDILAPAGASASTAPMYFPAGTGGNPYPLLKGRPVLVAEQCPTLGTPGDIMLTDFSQYALIDGGLKSALSLHVLWTSFQGVFRFTLRCAGLPMWATPITPFNGGPTRSPFVIMAQR